MVYTYQIRFLLEYREESKEDLAGVNGEATR